MTPADQARKIVSNPNGYNDDSVAVARALLDLHKVIDRAMGASDWRVENGQIVVCLPGARATPDRVSDR